jgi:hypothetical protein
MNKPLFVISCPIDCYSGYSAHSRDLVKSIIKLDKYDVKIFAQRWGGTPWGYINAHEQEWGFLKDHIVGDQKLHKQPDVWMQITVPNEFQSIGKYNIGVTAGIETTICHASWIEGLNRMDFNIVSSQHAKDVFLNSKFDKIDSKNNQKVGQIVLEKPIEVLFEGADLDLFFETKEFKNKEIYNDIQSLPDKFLFLFTGMWTQGDFGEDRKNVPLLIKSFLETFKNKKNPPALLLKTSFANSSNIDKYEILKRLNSIKESVKANSLPNIYVLLGDIHEKDMNELYNHPKIKTMVSLTKGEGFGRPLLEFSLTGKPIITTGWSGHLDFLKPEFTNLIGGDLKQIHPSACVENILIPESMWFNPNHAEIGYYFKNMFDKYDSFIDKAKRQRYYSKTNFSLNAMTIKLDTILNEKIPEFPKEIELKLPGGLKKVELPKLKLPSK